MSEDSNDSPAPNILTSAVAQGLTVTKIENETQQAYAIQRPRQLATVVQAAEAGLNFAPGFAARAFYSIPYRNPEGGETKVEGPSIKAAMELARCWGNCVNAGRIIDDQPDRVVVEGVFLDYETNLRTLRQMSVSKSYYSRKTRTMVPLREDRLNMAIQAGISKVVRNAILASLPAYVVDGYFHKAKKIAVEGLKGPKPEDRYKKAEKKFAEIGVTAAQLADYIKGLTMESEEDLLAHLIGIYNAIKDGQQKVEEVFPPVEEKPQAGEYSEGQLFKGQK